MAAPGECLASSLEAGHCLLAAWAGPSPRVCLTAKRGNHDVVALGACRDTTGLDGLSDSSWWLRSHHLVVLLVRARSLPAQAFSRRIKRPIGYGDPAGLQTVELGVQAFGVVADRAHDRYPVPALIAKPLVSGHWLRCVGLVEHPPNAHIPVWLLADPEHPWRMTILTSAPRFVSVRPTMTGHTRANLGVRRTIRN